MDGSRGGRPVVVHTRLTAQEADEMDARRGALSRAAWLRYLMLVARKQDIRFGPGLR